MFTAWEEPFDPNAVKEYAFQWLLNEGESLVDGAVEVDFVDPGSTDVVTPTDIQILGRAAGRISGNTWGVTVWFQGSETREGAYYVRCRVATDSTPFARKGDQTMRLDVAQQ